VNLPSPGVDVQSIVIFTIPWSIAAVVDIDGRQKFDQFYRQLLHGDIQDFPVPKCLVGKLELPSSDGLIYDFCWDVRVYYHIRFCAFRSYVKAKK